MGSLLSSGGFLSGFVLGGILLPIVGSFVVDGAVLYLRGRTPRVLLIASVLTLAILGLYSLAWQNAVYAGTAAGMAGAVGLILWFSVPAAALGFGIRMLALFLNPATRTLDREAIAARSAREAGRRQARQARVARHA